MYKSRKQKPTVSAVSLPFMKMDLNMQGRVKARMVTMNMASLKRVKMCHG